MPLTIIYGAAGTGKSEYCIDAMQALYKKQIPSIMIVPEQFAHSAESRLIDKTGFLSDDIQSVSFKRLAYKILKKNGKIRESISSVGKSMLLSKAILSCGNSLTLYKQSAAKPGFIDSMLTFIAECKRSQITPEMLASAVSDENPYFSMKLTDLAMIYQAYQDSLRNQPFDSEDYLTLLAEDLKQHNRLRGTSIFIDEFFRFTAAELDCIGALLQSGMDVFVTLGAPNPEAGGIFAPVDQTGKRLKQLALSVGAAFCEPIILSEKYRFRGSEELAHFESEYHHYPPTIYKEETHDITLYVAPDCYTEVQLLAAKIRHLVTEKGLRFRDVAIISGNPDTYEDLIKTVFPVYDIPVFIDQKRPLLTHPLMIMLTALFELLSGGIETEPFMSYIKTGYAGLSFDEADRLENFALAGRLRRKDWLDDTRFLKRADSVFYETEDVEEKNAEEAEELLLLRNRVLTPLLQLRNELAESRLLRHRAEALFHFFETIRLYDTVTREVESLKEHGAMQEAQEHGEVYNILISLLDELVLCLGDEKIGIRRLETIITAGLSQCEMATIPPSSDQVFLGDTGRSLVKNVKALFVIGANADAFPAAPPQEGLVKDAERAWLEKQGLSLGPDGTSISYQNQYLVYSALNISSSTMHVSYAVSDLEGKGLGPSPLIQRLHKLFPALSVSDHLVTPPQAKETIAGKASAWQYMLEHFRDNDNLSGALKQYFSQDTQYQEAYRAAVRYSQYTHQVPDLSPGMAQALYGKNLRGSVTQLEKHSACPFSYFLQYGLKAKERKVLQIDAPDIGILLHQLIEIATKRLYVQEKSFGSLDANAVKQLADETVEELLGTLFIKELYTENRFLALVQSLKTQVAKLLQVIVTHVTQGQFEPCAFEVAFSENGELPPVTIPLPTGETITLIGRIDRIDVMRQEAELYIKIIDYKTGNKKFSLCDLYNGLSLQLAVYVTAAQEGGSLFNGQNIKPAGMFYFRLVDKTVSAAETNPEAALLKQFKMSGLLLNDADIVRAMDMGIKGSSTILPAYLKQDGTLSESGGSYATSEQFKILSKYIRRTAGKIGHAILSGSVAVSPCKNNKQFPCRYCRFHPVCSFSPEIDPYRVALPFKDDVVWELLEKEEK